MGQFLVQRSPAKYVCVSLNAVKCSNNIYHEYVAGGQTKKEDYQKTFVCSPSETATMWSTITLSHSFLLSPSTQMEYK